MAASKRTFDDYVTSQVDTVDSSPQHPTILAPSPSPDPPKDVTPQDQPADKKSTSDRPSGRPNDERAPGTTLLPLSRVQKIMKADKELGAAGKEAVFLIAVATVCVRFILTSLGIKLLYRKSSLKDSLWLVRLPRSEKVGPSYFFGI